MTYRNDETLECLDCGRLITWTYRKQRHFKEQGWEQPKYCRECSKRRQSYYRSSQRDHPSPVLPDVFLEKEPRLDAPPSRKPLMQKRPSWWTNPRNRLNFVLGLLVVVLVGTLFLLVRVLFSG